MKNNGGNDNESRLRQLLRKEFQQYPTYHQPQDRAADSLHQPHQSSPVMGLTDKNDRQQYPEAIGVAGNQHESVPSHECQAQTNRVAHER